jgi:hypothetical protein
VRREKVRGVSLGSREEMRRLESRYDERYKIRFTDRYESSYESSDKL